MTESELKNVRRKGILIVVTLGVGVALLLMAEVGHKIGWIYPCTASECEGR